MKTITGVVLGIILMVFVSSIEKSKSQICKTYSKYPFGDMKKDIDYYYSKGYRVVSISSYGESGLYASAILVMEN